MILILAYGNSLREDDGAGLHLGRRLENLCLALGLPSQLELSHQLHPEMALLLVENPVQAVIFADCAAVDPDSVGLAVDIQPLTQLAQASSSATLGHHVGPHLVLEYARLFSNTVPPAWLITVPGVAFNHGEGLSETAQTVLNTAEPRLRQFLQQFQL